MVQSNVMEGKISNWFNKGLNTIGDLIGEDGEILSIEVIQNNIQENCNFLWYIRIKRKYKIS